MGTLISTATERNWARLNTDSSTRLTRRANKKASRKKILPTEYVTNKSNIAFVQHLVKYIEDNSWDIERVVYSVAVKLLQKKGILHTPHVQSVLSEYRIDVIPALDDLEILTDEWDLLGLIYQSMLPEGKKNTTGSYYTPQKIALNMTKDFDFSCGQTFLDPCCGSGSFLLALDAAVPEQLFGFDNDPIAVMIAKVNLLLKYCNCTFMPQVFCVDYLSINHNNLFAQSSELSQKTFDYIATNPPWGAVSTADQIPLEITSKESFSCFFVNAYTQLKENGIIRFLFPEAVLNVKAHKDIRTFMLNCCCIEQITMYNGTFSGVTTKYIDISCKKARPKETLLVNDQYGTRQIQTSGFCQTENCVFCFLSSEDLEIIHKIKAKGQYDLSNSIWALGIVTGDNRNKLKKTYEIGYEAIFTGKEIARYVLKPVKNYLLYDRSQLQQVAKEKYYRAHEKLVYKFISNKLVFAYDDSKSLFLNSANILIPDIPHMGIKTVMAFLNSELFQYFYVHMFGEVKILKGNLMKLSFPEITEEQNQCIESIVDKILDGDSKQDEVLQTVIYALYDFSEKQIMHIRRSINGTIG